VVKANTEKINVRDGTLSSAGFRGEKDQESWEG
jgi:hypothetical protein